MMVRHFCFDYSLLTVSEKYQQKTFAAKEEKGTTGGAKKAKEEKHFFLFLDCNNVYGHSPVTDPAILNSVPCSPFVTPGHQQILDGVKIPLSMIRN